MTRIRSKNKRKENILLTNNKNQEKMKHLMKGIRIAAYIAEIIVAGSTIVELVEKYSGRSKRKSAASKVDTGNVATENP